MFGVAAGLAIAEARIQAQVLGHRGVGVEPDLSQAPLCRALLGMSEERAADAASLEGGVDRDVLHEQVIGLRHEDDQADRVAAFHGDLDVTVADLRDVVVVHRRRPAPDALDVAAVRTLDDVAQGAGVIRAGGTNLHARTFSESAVSDNLPLVLAYRTDGWTALADPTRRAVLARLAERPRPVGELARELPVSRPAVSQHLRVLKEAGLVIDEPVGTRRIYRVDPDGLAALRTELEGFWTTALANYKAIVESTKEEDV